MLLTKSSQACLARLLLDFYLGSNALLQHFKMVSPLAFIVRQPWLFAIFLLPISFCYDVFWFLRSKVVLFLGSAPKKHKQRVEYVQQQVRDWQRLGNGRKMCTARPTWMSITPQRITYKDKSYKVEVKSFHARFSSSAYHHLLLCR